MQQQIKPIHEIEGDFVTIKTTTEGKQYRKSVLTEYLVNEFGLKGNDWTFEKLIPVSFEGYVTFMPFLMKAFHSEEVPFVKMTGISEITKLSIAIDGGETAKGWQWAKKNVQLKNGVSGACLASVKRLSVSSKNAFREGSLVKFELSFFVSRRTGKKYPQLKLDFVKPSKKRRAA